MANRTLKVPRSAYLKQRKQICPIRGFLNSLFKRKSSPLISLQYY